MKKTFIAFLAAIMAVMIVFTASCASSCNEEQHTHNLTHVAAVSATCTEAGNTEYWYCDDCDKYFSDAEADVEISVHDTEIAALGHDWATTWSMDADGHWHACTRCGAKADEANHTLVDGVCSVCGYGQATHTHNLVATDAQEATCTEPGNIAYWYCADCDKYFSDAEGTVEITLADTVIAALNHVETTEWEHDDTYHWQICSRCQQIINKAVHDSDGENGACSTCGYVSETPHVHSGTLVEAVPATCTTAGNSAYYTCDCGKLFSDEACTNQITLADTVIDALGHVETTEWNHDSVYHWQVCSRCQQIINKAEHDTNGTDGACSVCGYKVDASHVHSATAVPAKEATCTTPGNTAYWYCEGCETYFSDAACTQEIMLEDTVIPALNHAAAVAVPAKEATCTTPGNIAYWYCSDCDKYFSDADCTTEIAQADTVIAVNPANHKWDTAWSMDETNHWHACLNSGCGETSDLASHTLVNGICSVCGFDANGDIEYIETKYAFDYDAFIANCGSTEKVKTTIPVTVGKYTVNAGVYYENSSSGLTGKVINTQGAANAFTIELNGVKNSITGTIRGASSTSPNAVTVSRIDENGTILSTITVSADLTNSATMALNVTDLPAGTYVFTAAKSIRVAQLSVTEYTLPHICVGVLVEEATPATCTEAGNIAYWQCEGCGKYYSDAACENEITLEQTVIPATGHEASTAWSYDETGHWHVCLNNCGEKLEFAAHDTNGAGGACSVCGYIEGHTHTAQKVVIDGACSAALTEYYQCSGCGTMFKDEACTQVLTAADIEALSAHTLEHHAAVEATCTEAGSVEYWYCTACDKYYLDAEATNETDMYSLEIEALGHVLGNWEYDSLTHYKSCTRCGEVDETTRGEHSFDANDDCTVCGYHVDTSVLENIDTYGAYNESMYAVLKSTSADGITAQYSVANANDWVDVDSQLIRVVDGQTRVDVVGVTEGKYDLKIVIASKDVVLEDIAVEAYDRAGYAFFNYDKGIGAYDLDGTLKDGALVIYVTDENKNDISNDAYVYSEATKSVAPVSIDKYFQSGTDKSIGYFLNNRQYSDKDTYGIKAACDDFGAVDIRIIGKVNAEVSGDAASSAISGLTVYDSTENGGSVGDNGRMARMTDVYNLTIEGIGEDAQVFGWGFHVVAATGDMTQYGVHEGESFEARNITFANYPEDAIGMEGIQEGSVITVPVQRCWVHNNTFMPGYCASPAESDKAEGDGSCDFKRGYYYTFAYNYLEGCHKTNLIGSSDSSLQYNITMHHNMWKNCGSRIPLARQANIHFYNNYIYGEPGATLSYVMSPRANSYLFVEANYFDGCKNIVDGSGGATKFYKNTFYACYDDIPAQVTDRNATVSNNCAYNGTDYSKFDTDAELFYLDNYYVTDSVTARKEVLENAGSNGHYNGAIDMNEVNPTQTVSVGSEGLTIDLSQVQKGSVSYVSGVAFNNISGMSSGTVKGKGQIATFTLTSEAQLTLSGSGSGAAAGELVCGDGTVYASKINGTVTVVLPAGTYFIASGIKDKEFTISGISFADTSASSAARVEAATNAINAIPSTVTISDEATVVAARQAYDALTSSEKAEFSSALVTKLENAEKTLGNIKVDNVIDLIDNIGQVTADSYNAINAARTAYNALTTEQKDQVTNYNVLTAAEAAFEGFEVTNVNNMIDALAATTSVSVGDKTAVQQSYDAYKAAYDAYMLLDDAQLNQVGSARYDKVTAGMAYLESIIAVYDFQEVLAGVTDPATASMAELGAVVTAYNKLVASVASQVLTSEEQTKYEAVVAAYEVFATQTTVITFVEGDENFYTNHSSMVTVSGNLSTSKGSVVYNGVTYDGCLKIESSTNITLNLSGKQTITMYFGEAGKKIKIDGTAYTAQSDATVSTTLEAGTHTITKGDTMNLFVIVLGPAA